MYFLTSDLSEMLSYFTHKISSSTNIGLWCVLGPGFKLTTMKTVIKLTLEAEKLIQKV